jgi:serine/threonine-protein kinase
MGVVYEALHLRLRQRVAIKMLLPEMMSVPDVVSRFEREARAAGQLRGENAARVLDVEATAAGVPYMVMEFLDGHDLSDQIVRQGQLEIPQAVDYVLQACSAMREAHRLGIVHRDLKPSNLFLAKVEGRWVIKVLDFGISKVEDDREARVTGTQATVGTPLYMSPEQIRSAKHVDPRTDIWSLGIILYELLAGKTPYEGSTTAAAVAICVDAVPSLRAVRPDVPPLLEEVILKALAKERNDRFPTVEALASALAPFAGPSGVAMMASQPSLSHITSAAPSNPSTDEVWRARTEMSDPAIGAKRAGTATAGSWSTQSGGRKRTSPWLIAVMAASGAAIGIAIAIVAVAKFSGPKPTPSAEPHQAAVGATIAPTPTVTTTAEPQPLPTATHTTPPATLTTPTVKRNPPPPASTNKPPASATAHPTQAPTNNTGAPTHI